MVLCDNRLAIGDPSDFYQLWVVVTLHKETQTIDVQSSQAAPSLWSPVR